MFQPLQGHLQGSQEPVKHYIKQGRSKNTGINSNEDGLVKAETYVGVKE
jgi:hypothetical protein